MRSPRKLKLKTTGVFHKMWRGHNREYVLKGRAAKLRYLGNLTDTKDDAVGKDVRWFSYCIMDNHTHEVGQAVPRKGNTESSVRKLGNWMRNAHARYGQWYNQEHNRQGKVAYDRPKTQEIEDQNTLLTVMAYGDANPVRAGKVKHPRDYAYSSYNFYAYGKRNEVTEHLDMPSAYLALGKTAAQRQRGYRRFVDHYLRNAGLINDQVGLSQPSSFLGSAQWRRNRQEMYCADFAPS